jgi:DNA (cytosine-5)-methyltransferase 1
VTGISAVSLFAGVGGFDLALERAGVRVAAAAEIEPDCSSVLARHFPRTALFPDVTKVTGDQLRAAGFDPLRGIVTAGFPCQDISVAGRRAGLAGARSGLFWHVVRLADELRPRWLLVENTPGLLSSNGGRDMGTVVGALADLGYGICWRVLDAEFLGLAQRRARVFIVGCAGDGAAPVEVLLEPEGGGRDPAAGGAAQAGAPGRAAGSARGHRRGGGPVTVVSTLQGGGRRGHRIDAEGAAGGHLVLAAGRARRLTPLECERLQGFPDDWTRWTADGREQSDSARYRQIGNAVAVPVAEWIGRRIAAADAASARTLGGAA